MSKPKVSVVIPVYKAEAFIEKCCRSLFEQTLESLEYIFINDCTPDDSVQVINRVLEDYPSRKHQVHFINHIENKGVAITRERGNSHATGEYIIHCDSDDWVDRQAYEIMYNEAVLQNAEIVGCAYVVPGDEDIIFKYPVDEENKDNLNFSIQPLYGAVWNKLIKKQLYQDNNIHVFDGINMSEDLGLVLRLRFFSKKTIFINKPLYYHTADNSESIVYNFSIDKCLEIVKCAKHLEKFFRDENVEEKYFISLQYLKFQSKQLILINKTIRDINLWKSIFPETHTYIWKFKESPFHTQLITWLIHKNMILIAKALLYIKDKKH